MKFIYNTLVMFPLIIKLMKFSQKRKCEIGMPLTTGQERMNWAAKCSLVREWRYRQSYRSRCCRLETKHSFPSKLPLCSLDDFWEYFVSLSLHRYLLLLLSAMFSGIWEISRKTAKSAPCTNVSLILILESKTRNG